MKKIGLALLILAVVCIAAVYLFIPDVVQHNSNRYSPYRYEAVVRQLKQPANWLRWAADTTTTQGVLEVAGVSFKPDSFSQSALYFSPVKPAEGYQLRLGLKPVNGDSTQLLWEFRSATSYNPLKRITRFNEAKQLMKAVDQLADRSGAFYRSIGDIYGYPIQEALVTDSLLVSTSATSNSYPDITFIYQLIDQLHQHISRNQATATGHPMLNILTLPAGGYLVRVAIPVNKELPQTSSLQFKRMLGGGNILITEVTGGSIQIDKAMTEIENYIKDFKRMSPAIPFLSLVTDRRQQPDSNRWVTRIYYPVM